MKLKNTGVSLHPDRMDLIDLAAEHFSQSRNKIIGWMVDDAVGIRTPHTYASIKEYMRMFIRHDGSIELPAR